MRVVPLGIVVQNGKFLLVHRRFPPVLWGPPGGFTEENESLNDAVQREVYEECGINCEAIARIYEFDAYNAHIVVFACKYISGKLRCSYESTDLGWFKIDELPEPLSPDKFIFETAREVIDQLK